MADKKRLYAVYGSLRKGLGNHRVLGNSKFVGEHTTDPNYTMYSLSAFPGVVKGGSTPIKLEIYEAPDDATEARLDMLEGYHGPDNPRNFYNKEVIETPYGEAFIYYINTDMGGGQVVESGDWTEFRNK